MWVKGEVIPLLQQTLPDIAFYQLRARLGTSNWSRCNYTNLWPCTDHPQECYYWLYRCSLTPCAYYRTLEDCILSFFSGCSLKARSFSQLYFSYHLLFLYLVLLVPMVLWPLRTILDFSLLFPPSIPIPARISFIWATKRNPFLSLSSGLYPYLIRG